MEKNKLIEAQYQVIDDISTYGDMAKYEDKLFRGLVENRVKEYFNNTPLSSDGYKINIEQVYKECVFDKFKKGECDIIITNKASGHTFSLPDYKIDLIAPMVYKDNFLFFGIPKYIGDSKAVIIVQDDT